MPTIPGVVLAEEIGSGGFATVYRGTQTMIGRDVAVKIDTRHLTAERDQRRFEREVQAAGKVASHPNIVSLYDAGIAPDSRPYLVMELCPGGSYSQRIKQVGPVPLDEVIDVGIAIADALAAAHANGILHRDVKPGNILIGQYGSAMLADFGLAALPRPGYDISVTLESLTPAYSAPETFAMKPPTYAADLYGLGTTLYAMLQGRAPHSNPAGQAPSLPQLLYLLNEPLPALPNHPAAGPLMQVIWRSTAPNPLERYPSAAAMREALRAIRTGSGSGPGTRSLPAAPSGPGSQSGPGTGAHQVHPTGPWATGVNPLSSHATGSHATGSHATASHATASPTTGSLTTGSPTSGSPTTGAHAAGSYGPGARTDGQGIGPQPGADHTGPRSGGFTTFRSLLDPSSTQSEQADPTPSLTRPRNRATLIAIGVVVLLLAVTAAIVLPRIGNSGNEANQEPPATSSAGVPGASEVVATTAVQVAPSGLIGAPTSSVQPSQTSSSPTAPAVGDCYKGLNNVGDVRTATPVSSCSAKHDLEVFASGILSDDTDSPLASAVEDDTQVKKTCTERNLQKYLDLNNTDEYRIVVLPPREAAFNTGDRAFRCLAGVDGAGEVTTPLGQS